MKNFEDMDNKEFAFACLDELKKAGKLNTATLTTMTNPSVCHDLFHSSHFPVLKYRVNEDKLMGPYFISKKNLPEGEMFDSAAFSRIFKSKVIMYLFDDAAKQRRPSLFGGCDEKAQNQYSKICSEFDTKGVYIFCREISDQFIDKAPEDDEA